MSTSDCGSRTSSFRDAVVAGCAVRMRQISMPPIPAITAVSASPGFSFSRPSEIRSSIRSESPAPFTVSCALASGPFRRSMAMAASTIPFSTRYTGTYP